MLDFDLDLDAHATESIHIKNGVYADVDIEMVPIVNWLNAFDSITTLFCCQGEDSEEEGDKPYVMFVCDDPAELAKVMHAFGHNIQVDVTYLAGHVRYTARFSSPFHLRRVMKRLGLKRTSADPELLSADLKYMADRRNDFLELLDDVERFERSSLLERLTDAAEQGQYELTVDTLTDSDVAHLEDRGFCVTCQQDRAWCVSWREEHVEIK